MGDQPWDIKSSGKMWEDEVSMLKEADPRLHCWEELLTSGAELSQHCLNCCRPCEFHPSNKLDLLQTEFSSDAYDDPLSEFTNSLTSKHDMSEEIYPSDIIYVENVPFKISSVLRALYKCEDWGENLHLCPECLSALTELFKQYQKFENLRSMSSYLFRKIQLFELHVQTLSKINMPSPKPLQVFDKDEKDEPGTFQDVEISTCSSNLGYSSGPSPTSKCAETVTSTSVEGNRTSEDDIIGGAFTEPCSSVAAQKSSDPLPPKPKGHRPLRTKMEWKNKTVKPHKESQEERKKVELELVQSYRLKKGKCPNPCWYCSEHFESPEKCFEHTKSDHFNNIGFICKNCSRICGSRIKFVNHQQHQCAKFLPGQILTPLKCPHCSKRFSCRAELSSHVIIHKARAVECPHCNFTTNSNFNLRVHFARKHPDQQPPEAETLVSPPREFYCDKCPTICKSREILKIHMTKMHTEEGNKRYKEQQRLFLEKQKAARRSRLLGKTFICPECQVDCFNNHMLITHMKLFHEVQTHDDEKFICDQCGKAFARNFALQYHIQYVHTDARPFGCEHCAKCFKTAWNLKDHVRRTHSEEGKKKYNEFMRQHNERRRLVKQALIHREIIPKSTRSKKKQGDLKKSATVTTDD